MPFALQQRKWVDCASGSRLVLVSRLPRPFPRCVNMIAILRLSKESYAYKLIIQPSFFQHNSKPSVVVVPKV